MKKQKSSPPRLGTRLLKLLLTDEERFEKLGDFEEAFDCLVTESGIQKARVWFWGEVLGMLPTCVENFFYWRWSMFLNYLKVTWRNIKKNKIISLINIFSLSISITFGVLVFLFVKSEYSFDRFHVKSDRIYRVMHQFSSPKRNTYNALTPLRMADDLKDLFPEVEKTVRLKKNNVIVGSKREYFNEDLYFVGKDFFNVFSFPITNGDQQDPLGEPHHVVLSSMMADKLYKENNPIGKQLFVIQGEEKKSFVVSAVFDNRLGESSIVADVLVSFDLYREKNKGNFMMTSYRALGGETFIQLREGIDKENFNKKMARLGEYVDFKLKEKESALYQIQPLKDIHLRHANAHTLTKVGYPIFSFILSALGFLVIIIGSINFITSALGRAVKKSYDVGIRKAIGASKSQISRQYLGETMIFTFFACMIGVILARLVLPWFSNLAARDILFSLDITFLVGIILIMVLVGVVAGGYPAFVLSRFHPARVLKGKVILKGRSRFNRTLLVVQFGISAFLIISTLIMREQLIYLRQFNLGFNRERLVQLYINSQDDQSPMVIQRFKNQMEGNGSILSMAAAATPNGSDWTMIGAESRDREPIQFFYNLVDYDFIKTMGMEMVQGRDFSRNFPGDITQGIIVNETFVKQFGLKDPIGKWLDADFKNNPRIIGVVKDFHFASLHEKISPVALTLSHKTIRTDFKRLSTPGWPPVLDYVFIRISPGDTRPIMDAISGAWKEVSPDSPLEISFVDDMMNQQYRTEDTWKRIINSAAFIAIVIAALGLFGFSLLIAEKQMKEIGIRKIMGAGVSRLVLFFGKNLLVLVGAANILVWPLAYAIMDHWLGSFEYRIDLSPSLFFISLIVTLGIAALTISYQAVKSSRVNPVEIVKYE